VVQGLPTDLDGILARHRPSLSSWRSWEACCRRCARCTWIRWPWSARS